jgi:hypothetical protein
MLLSQSNVDVEISQAFNIHALNQLQLKEKVNSLGEGGPQPRIFCKFEDHSSLKSCSKRV